MIITVSGIQELAGGTFSPSLPGDLLVGLNHSLSSAKPGDVVFLPFDRPNNDRFYNNLMVKDKLKVRGLISDQNHPSINALTIPKLVVEDAYQLYQRLAKLARSRFEGNIIMIIGSAGKTALKIYLNQLMSDAINVMQ